MLYLVDGYNVTKGDPATSALSLEAQREALIARLRVRGGRLLGAGRIVIVFDGESGRAGHGTAARADTHPVEVVYSRGRTADDAIVERIASAHGEPVCVVSSDRGLADRVRDHRGARVDVRPRETVFDEARGPARTRKRRDTIAREHGLPAGANRITEELKRHWLNEEE